MRFIRFEFQGVSNCSVRREAVPQTQRFLFAQSQTAWSPEILGWLRHWQSIAITRSQHCIFAFFDLPCRQAGGLQIFSNNHEDIFQEC